MPPLPIISAKELIKFLESKGFIFVRQNGSHKRYKRYDGKYVTVPYHGSQDIKRGTLNAILNDTNISVDELIEYLNK